MWNKLHSTLVLFPGDLRRRQLNDVLTKRLLQWHPHFVAMVLFEALPADLCNTNRQTAQLLWKAQRPEPAQLPVFWLNKTRLKGSGLGPDGALSSSAPSLFEIAQDHNDAQNKNDAQEDCQLLDPKCRNEDCR